MTILTQFLRARLDEDEAAARAAVEPDRPGTHWEWIDPDDDTAASVEDGYLSTASLRTVETFPAAGDGEEWMLPGFIIHTAEEVPEGAAVHIARNSPARVLREVEAKRRVMERHSPVPLGPRAKKGTPHSCAGCNFEYGDIDFVTDDIEDCPELRDLAAPYADHPDFDPNWSTT